KVLVVVDQAEELVTITADAERRAFLEALTTSCTAPSPLRIVMTARTDMWDRVAAETTKFAMAVAPTVLHVPPLSRTDLAVVINEVNDQQVYAPADESLFSAWPPLAALIEARRDDLLLRGRLERRATDWRDAGATQSGLLSGLELDQARAWRQRNTAMATAD